MELSNSNFHSNDSNFQQPDTVEKDQLDVYLDEQLNAANKLHFGAGYLKEDYKTTLRDQNATYVLLGYQYSLNAFWSTGVDARFERTKFTDDPNNLNYDTTRLLVALIYKPVRPLEVRFSVGRDKRSANVSTSSYTDNIGIIGVEYRFY
jgi:hypothetical protein